MKLINNIIQLVLVIVILYIYTIFPTYGIENDTKSPPIKIPYNVKDFDININTGEIYTTAYEYVNGSEIGIISKIDPTTHSMMDLYQKKNNKYETVAYNSFNESLYVLDSRNNTLQILDLNTNQIFKILPLNQSVSSFSKDMIVFNYDTNKAYVTTDGEIFILNALNHQLEDIIQASSYSSDITLNSEINQIFISNEYREEIYTINGSNNVISHIVNVPLRPVDLDVGPYNWLYVLTDFPSELVIFEPKYFSIREKIPMYNRPHSLIIHDSFLYVSDLSYIAKFDVNYPYNLIDIIPKQKISSDYFFNIHDFIIDSNREKIYILYNIYPGAEIHSLNLLAMK